MSDLQQLHPKQGNFTQAEHQRKLAIASGVIFTHAIADRSGNWELMEREDVTSRIDKRDPITNAPLPQDNFIACDKHENRRRGKFLIAKHLPPATVEVLRLVLQRTSADRKTIPILLGTPMSITARAGGLFESVSTHLFQIRSASERTHSFSGSSSKQMFLLGATIFWRR